MSWIKSVGFFETTFSRCDWLGCYSSLDLLLVNSHVYLDFKLSETFVFYPTIKQHLLQHQEDWSFFAPLLGERGLFYWKVSYLFQEALEGGCFSIERFTALANPKVGSASILRVRLRLSPGCFRSLDEKTFEIQNASNWPWWNSPKDAQMYMGPCLAKRCFSCEICIISEVFVDRCS